MKPTKLLLFTAILCCLNSCNEKKEESKMEPLKEYPNETAEDTSIERGSYLVTLMDCNTCHTPKTMTERGPQPDMSLRLSGYPSSRVVPEFDGSLIEKGIVFFHPDLTSTAGPWGISFAANLTPDDTGIGSWSLEQFEVAMRKGKHKGLEGSRMLLPPMPWQSYASLTDGDLEAIFNYLKSIKPIENVVPAPVPPTSNP